MTETYNKLSTLASWSQDAYLRKIKEQDKQIRDIKNYIKNLIKASEEIHWPSVVSFLDTPISEYDDIQKQIAKLNPELFNKSRKIDELRDKMDLLENWKINLQKAYSDMKLANKRQRDAINESAERWLHSIAQQQEIQRWAAAWLAWNAWATTWMLANANAEIANKYAPMTQQIEQQRQAWLANAAQSAMNIPAAMSWIQAQNIINQSNILNNKKSVELLRQLKNWYKQKVQWTQNKLPSISDLNNSTQTQLNKQTKNKPVDILWSITSNNNDNQKLSNNIIEDKKLISKNSNNDKRIWIAPWAFLWAKAII